MLLYCECKYSVCAKKCTAETTLSVLNMMLFLVWEESSARLFTENWIQNRQVWAYESIKELDHHYKLFKITNTKLPNK